MFIVPFKSESGDSYLIGPFPHPPTHEMVMQVFRISCPDEAEYLEEMVQDGMYNGSPFTAYLLPSKGFGVVDLQQGGHACPIGEH